MGTRDDSTEQLFGTDGIRGTPGVYPLTDGMVFKIGIGAARLLHYKKEHGINKCKVVLGKDTRSSGNRIEAILVDAFTSSGVDVMQAGVISTPGLSFLVSDSSADLGVMISASHNKASDNGIKFFNHLGRKLSLQDEQWIEEIIFHSLINIANGSLHKCAGNAKILKDAQSHYVNFLASSMKGVDLKGFRVGLDCACGAGSMFARKLFKKLGAEVYAIHDDPHPDKINMGGSMNPDFLKKLVLKKKLDMGIALDGDGDRGVLIDDRGNILDGDFIMAIIARHLISKKSLPQNTIVATVMSNLGLRLSLEEVGGKIISTKVGDKYVLEGLVKHKLNLGGEQSGHIIFLDYLPTPDGLLTGLQVLKVMKETGISLSKLAECMSKLPQILVNIKVKERLPFSSISQFDKTLSDCEAMLGDCGRVLVRYSGTEPLARVMVEGPHQKEIEKIANTLAGVIKEAIGHS